MGTERYSLSTLGAHNRVQGETGQQYQWYVICVIIEASKIDLGVQKRKWSILEILKDMPIMKIFSRQ